MRGEAAKRIGHLYPKARLPDGPEATVIARLWARTVASPNPASDGAHVPLASSFVLSSKKGREAIVVPVVENGGYRFTVSERKGSPFQSRDEPEGRVLGQVRRRLPVEPSGGRCLGVVDGLEELFTGLVVPYRTSTWASRRMSSRG